MLTIGKVQILSFLYRYPHNSSFHNFISTVNLPNSTLLQIEVFLVYTYSSDIVVYSLIL